MEVYATVNRMDWDNVVHSLLNERKVKKIYRHSKSLQANQLGNLVQTTVQMKVQVVQVAPVEILVLL